MHCSLIAPSPYGTEVVALTKKSISIMIKLDVAYWLLKSGQVHKGTETMHVFFL